MERLTGKLLSWASILDENTRLQAERLSRLPFVYPHVALMPDAHLGKGATVGSVLPTHRAVVPAAVGVDIGCGMQSVRTQLTVDDVDPEVLRNLRMMIQANVPSSAGGYNTHRTSSVVRRVDTLTTLARNEAGFDPHDHSPNWQLQLGSLGSGNHFIEVVRDERGALWTFVHSGSRGVGNKIAQRHITTARDLHRHEGTRLEDPDLAWLVEGTPEFARYVAEMRWAQRFAWVNREEMTDRVIWCLERATGHRIERTDEVHCHHNYTTQEEHHGRTVWLTRKGAIDAHRDVRGLIPGSMGAASFVVRGLGNALALHSAPHGAGRLHSRRSAKDTFTVDELSAHMAERGVEYDREHARSFLDEAPGAYKPIDEVMADARSLVLVEHEFTQLVNVKGT